jgi:hypothetical protein
MGKSSSLPRASTPSPLPYPLLYLSTTQKYPTSRITALSNSSSQKTYIENTATERGLTNLEVPSFLPLPWFFYFSVLIFYLLCLKVITADVNTFDFEGKK